LDSFAAMLRIVALLLGVLPQWAHSQNPRGTAYHAARAVDNIYLDGKLTEQSWKRAQRGEGFFMSKPYDSVPPSNNTYFYITFDDNFLYIAFECEDDGGEPVVQSLRRDFEFRFNDNVGFYFDPYNDYTNGFYFNITPYGVQREGLMANGGASPEDFSEFWDNKWYSAVERDTHRWIAELAIPFKSIRYNRSEWNFNVLRNDLERNQVSSWIATPVQYLPASFAWSGKLIWDDELPRPGMNISLIPYVAASFSEDRQAGTPIVGEFLTGFDAKVGLSPSLNLDLTFNPDFSQVEVDRQVINLTRFEFQFPELRQFFLENSDLFAQPGFPDSRPFFSRRIGLAADSLGNLRRVPILYGARLSGKMGKNWRIGVLNMHQRSSEEAGLPEQNYTMAIVQRQILARSNVDVFVVNTQSLHQSPYNENRYYNPTVLQQRIYENDTIYQLKNYNRVVGFDFNINSRDNQIRGDIYYHHSFDEYRMDNAFSAGSFLGYFSRRLALMGAVQFLGENYRADAGFVPGLQVYPGFTGGFMRIEHRTYPQSRVVANYGPNLELNGGWIPTGLNTDQNIQASYVVQFLNTATVSVSGAYTYQYITRPFNPIGRGEGFRTFAIGDEFTWGEAAVEYRSDNRKLFNYRIQGGIGGFYDGTRMSANGEVNYRYQPYGSLSIRFTYENIDLTGEYGTRKLFLLGPRLDLTLTDKIFLTTFIQYNNAADNINLNTRFQWRFMPASDFFVVYTENYFPSPFGSKNRALVFKLTYWFNI
jgi:hypothetical protein